MQNRFWWNFEFRLIWSGLWFKDRPETSPLILFDQQLWHFLTLFFDIRLITLSDSVSSLQPETLQRLLHSLKFHCCKSPDWPISEKILCFRWKLSLKKPLHSPSAGSSNIVPHPLLIILNNSPFWLQSTISSVKHWVSFGHSTKKSSLGFSKQLKFVWNFQKICTKIFIEHILSTYSYRPFPTGLLNWSTKTEHWWHRWGFSMSLLLQLSLSHQSLQISYSAPSPHWLPAPRRTREHPWMIFWYRYSKFYLKIRKTLWTSFSTNEEHPRTSSSSSFSFSWCQFAAV